MAERRLYDAAAMGDKTTLKELLQQDPLVLDRVSYASPNKTPLHIATIKGHLPFVEEILYHNPHLAEELDSQQSSALHIASAKGYIEIVKKLLSAAPHMCMSRDSQGRNPLHLAAIKGHVEVLEELFRVAPSAAREKVDGGLSLLHLCVKYGQFEALKILVPKMNELLSSKDDDGDTILHMAVRDLQTEVIKLLLTMDALEVNALNRNGMTAIDVLFQSKRDAKNSEIEKLLKRVGGFGTLKNFLFEQQDEWLEKKRSALMVVASLLTTITFQVGVNPPGGFWQEDSLGDQALNPQPASTLDSLGIQLPSGPHMAGTSVMAQKHPFPYRGVYICNTTSLIASLSIILLLMSGLPIRQRFFMWILMIITWIAIVATALTYIKLICLLTPIGYGTFNAIITHTLYVWICVTGLLVIGHAIRLIVKLVKMMRKTFMRRSSGSTIPVNNVGIFGYTICLIVQPVKKLMKTFMSRSVVAGSAVPMNNVGV